MRKLFLLLLPLLFLTSCSDEPATGPLPVITWVMSSGRFRVMEGESIMLVPDVENLDETSTYQWLIDDRLVSMATSYTYVAQKAGEYYVKFIVTNRYGQAEDEVKITVTENTNDDLPEIPQSTGLRSPWTEINIAQGRTIRVVTYVMETGRMLSTVFTASALGQHTVTLTDEESGLSQDFVINVCPPAGEYRRSPEGEACVNRVYEFMPAPGHQVNGYIIIGDRFPANCTHEEACDSALSFFRTGKSISLGGQGGYVIAGFDHSVPNLGDYDLCIKGNPYSYQSEPGIVWVSQDVNGDGLPNDQWFELAGSEYGTDNHTTDYAITYYRPEEQKSAVGWRDCLGATGYVPYMSYWNPKPYYWMDWMQGTEWTYFGSRLRDRSTYENGYSDIPPYDWGYADNLGSDLLSASAPLEKANYFKISNARTWDGQPAHLEYIDFVKVQTAQTGATPNLGEISTEVYYIGDCHLQ